MTQKIFCYHCRVHHAPELMGRHETKKGPRWRCLRTIAAAQATIEARDAFGRTQSEANQMEAQRIARQNNQLRLFGASS